MPPIDGPWIHDGAEWKRLLAETTEAHYAGRLKSFDLVIGEWWAELWANGALIALVSGAQWKAADEQEARR